MTTTAESHPLEPFLPANAGILFLGSFPPKKEKWSMDFFYPNFINDFWRIMGHIFFNDRSYFIIPGEKRFDRGKITGFCISEGIALHDSACKIIRMKDNASDNFLKIEERTDLAALLEKIPCCKTIAATGQKSAETIVGYCNSANAGQQGGTPARQAACIPEAGAKTSLIIGERPIELYRMPSTSRAYPMKFEEKAAMYSKMLKETGIL